MYLSDNLVNRKSEALQVLRESWKQAHDAAMECYAVQDSVRQLNSIYEQSCRLDEDFRLAAARDELDYSEELIADFSKLFSIWIEAAEGIESAVRTCEDRGFIVDESSNLRKNLECAKACASGEW